MARRIHIPLLRIGDVPLDPAQAHHARDVLRLADGTVVEAFDDAGATASGILLHRPAGETLVRIERVNAADEGAALQWIVAAAVPKGDRADWMVEKLSELGATAFIPLSAARSVVLPEGKNKRERWARIATEAAKQSRRSGVMRVEELMSVERVLERTRAGAWGHADKTAATGAWVLATEPPSAVPISAAAETARGMTTLLLFIGPEGGWTQQELQAFEAAGVKAVRLGATILRIETAAVAAGAVVVALLK